MSLKHKCAATGCTVMVPNHFLMCLRHWYQVPYAMRQLVGSAYRDWEQGADTGAESRALIEKLRAAQRAAVEAVDATQRKAETTKDTNHTKGTR